MLKDIKIIDFSSVLAGPAVATFFAELGAEVTKIENSLQNGDVTRSWKVAGESTDINISAYFSSVNYKKNYLFLNVYDPNDLAKLLELVKDCDVFITNYKTASLLKMGLNPEVLLSINPKLIYASITGFESEPNRVAYDVVMQAETGFMSMNGTPDTAPVKLPLAFIDILAAHQLKEAILLAMLNRHSTGKGNHVSVSLEAAAIASLANQASNWLMAGHNPQPIGSLHPNIAPYGEIFKTLDNKLIVMAVGSDSQFRKMCSILGKPDIADLPKFSNNPMRVLNRVEMFKLLQPLFAQKERKVLMNEFIAQNVPAGAIKDVSEVFEQPFAKGMVLQEMIDHVETKRVQSVAFKFHNEI
jgi:crotonobetainyl-CoA:carnitine CoA-transferase CaiB-like acyl-CoA transferase